MIRWPYLATVVLTLVVASACSQQEDTSAGPPRPVMFTIAEQTSNSAVQLTGTIEARIKTEMGFRILGRITERKADVGDLVERGDVLAMIDPLALQLAVNSAQSDLASAQAQLINAVRTEARQKALAASRTTTQTALEEAEQARRTADASVAKARASLSKAEEQLSYAELEADFDGVITATSAEVGQVVSAGQTIMTIAQPDERDAVIDIPQSALADLELEAPFDVASQLDTSIVVKGKVREIAPAADTATRTRRVKIALSNPPAAFRLGSVVTAKATIAADPQVWIPATAILRRENGEGVWVVDVEKKTVRFQLVRTAREDQSRGDSIRIIEGIEPGDRVVTAGTHKLTDGQAVRVDQEDHL